MTLSRRSLTTGLISLVAAPAIVRASNIMAVKAMLPDPTVAPLFYQHRMWWVNEPQTIEWSSPLPPEMEALLKKRVDAAYGMLHRSVIANMEKQLYHSTGTDPLNGLFK
jgi:hypothetical protein